MECGPWKVLKKLMFAIFCVEPVTLFCFTVIFLSAVVSRGIVHFNAAV